MTRPVYVAGSALVCAAGDSPAAAAEALWAGACPAARRRLGERDFPYFALALPDAGWLARADAALALLAEQLADQLGGPGAGTPLFVASSSFQIGHFEELGTPFDLPPAAASFTRHIADRLGLSGPRHSVSNACISGFSAIDAARGLIAAGQIDDALVVGVELANASTLAGFAAMELLSPTACRPFDAGRDGLVLGEALAAVRLCAAPGRWRIAGLATGIDGHSPTGPAPDGQPIARVIADCLRDAAWTAADVELVKLQAAGSPGTDLAEANALRRVFAAAPPPLVSLKPGFGHTLGASGVAELTALLACLAADQIPATAGFATPDPEIGLQPTVDRSSARIRRALLNLVGFGGGLAALAVERAG